MRFVGSMSSLHACMPQLDLESRPAQVLQESTTCFETGPRLKTHWKHAAVNSNRKNHNCISITNTGAGCGGSAHRNRHPTHAPSGVKHLGVDGARV